MIGKCVDLSMSDGAMDGGRIWIFDHLANGKNQRWTMDYKGVDTSNLAAPQTTASAAAGPTQVCISLCKSGSTS